jgi:hypothetical protein
MRIGKEVGGGRGRPGPRDSPRCLPVQILFKNTRLIHLHTIFTIYAALLAVYVLSVI